MAVRELVQHRWSAHVGMIAHFCLGGKGESPLGLRGIAMAHTRKTSKTVASKAAEVLAGEGTKMDPKPAGASVLAQNHGKQSRLS